MVPPGTPATALVAAVVAAATELAGVANADEGTEPAGVLHHVGEIHYYVQKGWCPGFYRGKGLVTTGRMVHRSPDGGRVGD